MKRYSFRRSGDTYGAENGGSADSDDALIGEMVSFEKDLFDLIQFVKVQNNTSATRKCVNDLEGIYKEFRCARTTQNLDNLQRKVVLDNLQRKVILTLDHCGLEFEERDYQTFEQLEGGG